MKDERSAEDKAQRDGICRSIIAALKNAHVITRHLSLAHSPYSSLGAEIDCGEGFARHVSVTVGDDGMCRVFLSEIHDTGKGQSLNQLIEGTTIPLVVALSVDTPDLGKRVVEHVRAALLAE